MKRKFQLFCMMNIFIIAISLIGLTYGFLSVKIFGNSSSKLMSFTSKKVSVTYKEISNTSSGDTISPGYQYLKIFTATNTGNVEVKYHIYLDEVENNFIRVQDITYTLYRKSGNNSLTSSNYSTGEVVSSGTFPIINQYIKIDEILSKPNDAYTYALKINYNTSTESQDSDSGHVFGFKVQLHTNKDNTYAENTLAYNIIQNAIGVTNTEETNGTAKYRPTPTTNVASEISNSTEADLSQTVDDYGKTFYFRGNVKNNYVNFAGMCWRIVRILGDGSVKLVLEDKDVTCDSSSYTGNFVLGYGNFGYTEYAANTLTASDGTKNSDTKYIMNYLNGETNNTNSLAYAFKSFQTSKLSSYLDKLKAGDWCLNDKAYATRTDNTTPLTITEILDKQVKGENFYYDLYVRLYGKTTKEPTLKCNGTNMMKFGDNTNMYVGALIADEVVYAGGNIYKRSRYYYLLSNYQHTNSLIFFTMTPSEYIYNSQSVYYVFYDGSISDGNSKMESDAYSFRPSIILKSTTRITNGIGTVKNPYIISD